MNTRLYRRSRLYRSLFCIERNERLKAKQERRYRRLCALIAKKGVEIALDDYRIAMENKNWEAALIAQGEYMSFVDDLRKYDASLLTDMLLHGKRKDIDSQV